MPQRVEGVQLLSFDDLPAWIDIVLISHGHQDHFCPDELPAAGPRFRVMSAAPAMIVRLAVTAERAARFCALSRFLSTRLAFRETLRRSLSVAVIDKTLRTV
jgi:hypothetical protein